MNSLGHWEIRVNLELERQKLSSPASTSFEEGLCVVCDSVSTGNGTSNLYQAVFLS